LKWPIIIAGHQETCQVLMGHADSRTTKLYCQRVLQTTMAGIERIRYDVQGQNAVAGFLPI
jgi:hypothetical protein